MAAGWSIAGKRLELRPALPAGKLVIVDGGPEVKLKSKGSFPIEVDGQTYTLERKAGLMAPQVAMRAPDGRVVPPTSKHVARTVADAGSRCGGHPEREADLVCPRCGSFACVSCAGADATHCDACTQRLVQDAERRARDFIFMAPAFIFVISGGFLGALLGSAAGAAAVAIARRTESTGLKWAAAVGLYLLAAILFIVLAGAIQVAAGR